ncbi:GNAT family N-acetyltransferase [Actinoplanes sp. CA-054009]
MTAADQAARAWLELTEVLAGLRPDGAFRWSGEGTAAVITGIPLASLNGVVDITHRPDPARVDALASAFGPDGPPWSVQVRGNGIAPVAARLGLDGGHPVPFMLKDLTAADARPETGARRVTGADGAVFLRTLAAGFEVPEGAMAALADPALLDHPSMAAYLVEAGGEPVATAFGARFRDLVGVFNVAVPPAFRRRGFGRAATATVLSGAYADGARTAFLHATTPGRPLYERMGFRVAENWTRFS